MNIRCISNDSDIAAVAAVFTVSVHELGMSHYDATQRNAWAARFADVNAWSARLSGLRTLLAIEKNEIVGFISYEPNGHIEFLYTAPGFERQGVAYALHREVEKELPGVMLFTEAGLAAKPFFMQHGFTVVEEKEALPDGVILRRYAMRKAVAAQVFFARHFSRKLQIIFP